MQPARLEPERVREHRQYFACANARTQELSADDLIQKPSCLLRRAGVGICRCAGVTDDVLTACACSLTALSALDLTSCKQVCLEFSNQSGYNILLSRRSLATFSRFDGHTLFLACAGHCQGPGKSRRDDQPCNTQPGVRLCKHAP